MQENKFTFFKESIDSYALPERFTFPFYYQAHPLCLLAAKELQKHLKTQTAWQHNFGLNGETENVIGKMLGVLLVQNKNNKIGYLSAFSGKLANTNHRPHFVPPVFDMLAKDGFFIKGQLDINLINQQIEHLEKNPHLLVFETALKAEIESSLLKIKAHREKIIEGRKVRKQQRITAEIELDNHDFLLLKEQLSKESIKEKNQLRDLNSYWNERIQQAEVNLKQLTSEIDALKKQRKDLSAALQQKLFQQYHFLNSEGILKNLSDIFKDNSHPLLARENVPRLNYYTMPLNGE